MKKILLASLLIVSLLVSLSVGSFATKDEEILEEDKVFYPAIIVNEIHYGTPVVDGEVDDIYADTFQSRTGSKPNVYDTDESTASAVTYILWDENWFYFCTEVYDPNIDPRGEEWIWENVGRSGGPWNNECVELHISWLGADDDATTAQKWGVDCEGVLLYTNMGMTLYEGYEEAYAKTSMDTDSNTWVAEIAIPNVEGLTTGDVIGFCQQLNDLYDYAGEDGHVRMACFFGDQQSWDHLYTLVGEPQDTPATEAPTEPATEAPTETPTDAPTEAPTEKPTQPVDQPTQPATEAPTDPVQPATEDPTAPVVAPTEAPTEPVPTEPVTPTEPKPTEAATEKPTEKPTEASTDKPAEPTPSASFPTWGYFAIGGVACVVIAAAIAAVLMRKKK